MNLFRKILFAALLTGPTASGQQDTITFQWPNPPFASSHSLNATFAEFRNTLTADHFHNGVDIGEPDGGAIYSSLDGVVYTIGTYATSGSTAYVRVKTPVPGGWKHISYVHIEPAPGIAPGVPVTAGVTVIGNVLSGQGHVHFTEREIVTSENGNGVEINAVRSGGGLTPFDDFWAPQFAGATLQFRRAGSRSTLSPDVLFGTIDIVVRVNEVNSSEAIGGTRTNNGTYALGYRIVTPDSQSTVFEPPDAGLRYRFDRKPLDSYVAYAFDDVLSTTSAHYYYVNNGAGASAVNATRAVAPSPLDVSQIAPGDYLLQLFAFDTRQNRTDWYVPIHITDQDLSPPDNPTLLSALPDSDGIRITWLPPSDPDLNGYRLYVRPDDGGDFAVTETTLTAGMTSYKLKLPDDVAAPPDGLPRVQLRLTAVDTVMPPNESTSGDIYVATPAVWGGLLPGSKILMVDGFDRYGGLGSWGFSAHSFAVSTASAYPTNAAVGTSVNELVEGGTVSLQGWDIVQWILGDESTADNTLTSAEQLRVRQYLESGGSFIISGSEVGWDLGRTHNLSEPGDLAFYNNYLKAKYVYDGSSSMSNATGVTGTPFEGYTWTFGVVYPEDYPDDIDPLGGGSTLLTYNAQRDASTPRKAAVGFVGPFGQSTTTGRLVYLAFPYESMSSPLQRQVLFDKSLEFMGVTTGIGTDRDAPIPLTTGLDQNYPNPFNPTTTIGWRMREPGRVKVSVHDLLGREVAVLVDDERPAGGYGVSWNAAGFSTGTYVIRLETGSAVFHTKILLMK